MIIIKILAGILGLGILVFVHELGHFLLAKWNKVGVLDFAIGFGKILWSKKIGETRYSVRLIPLGGYVRMVGDDPTALDPDSDKTERDILESTYEPEDEEDQALLDDKSKWFVLKGYWAKAAIVIAGPAFNIIFAWLAAFTVLTVYGAEEPIDKPTIGKMMPKMPAIESGLKEGDEILKVNGEKVLAFSDFSKKVRASNGEDVNLLVAREDNNVLKEVSLTLKPVPESKEMALLTGNKKREFIIGVRPPTINVDVSFSEAIKSATSQVTFLTGLTFKSLYWMVAGKVSAGNISGPIKIVDHIGKAATEGVAEYLSFLIFLSISLAVLNMLPIPILDGGHLLLFTIEALTRKPISIKMQTIVNQIGMLLILSLMVFAIGNDIFGLFFGE